MHTITPNPKTTQQAASSKSKQVDQASWRPADETNTILQLQHIIGNQAVQRLLQSKSELLARNPHSEQRLIVQELHAAQKYGKQSVQLKEDDVSGVDPRNCAGIDEAIIKWGSSQVSTWINENKKNNKDIYPTLGEIKTWKRFAEQQEVDMDYYFRRSGQSSDEHVKWRVLPVQKDNRWVLESTITEWWDGHPMVVGFLPDGMVIRVANQCVVINVPSPPNKPTKPSPAIHHWSEEVLV